MLLRTIIILSLNFRDSYRYIKETIIKRSKYRDLFKVIYLLLFIYS